MLAKKPKMAVYTLAAVLLAAAFIAGCTFTGDGGDTEYSSAVSDNPAAPSDLFAASTGDIHDYMPDLLSGK